jgi:tripartite ATP-independent transporter DctP family solute receptor
MEDGCRPAKPGTELAEFRTGALEIAGRLRARDRPAGALVARGRAMNSVRVSIAIALIVWTGVAHGKDLRSSDVYSAEHPAVQAVAYLGRLVGERTSGRHRIVQLGENSKSSEGFTIAAVRNGTLDMARVNFASLSNLVPAAIVPALPYIFRSVAHKRQVLDGPIGLELSSELDRYDLVALGFYDTGARSYYGSKPIRKAGDLAGLRVRVPLSGSWASVLQVPGETTIAMPFEQIPAGLRSGAIDLAENNWPAFVASRHNEVAKYFSVTRHTETPAVLIMSKRVWQAFSAEDQAIIRAAAKESVGYFRKLWDENEATADKVSKALGVEIISDVDRQSFAAVAAPLYERQAASPKLQGLIKRIQAAE